MSARSDFMPVQYVELFASVQDSIPQWPIEHAKAIVEETLKSEHGLAFEDVFESIDPLALGCASIGQVHRAVLKDEWVNSDAKYSGGKEVAVKIMHPDARQRFTYDFQVFKWLTRVAMPGWRPLVDELERRLMIEFDYHNEAAALARVRENIDKSPYRRRVRIPQPYQSLCCKHLLVMELLDGKKLTDAIEDKVAWIFGGDREKAEALLAKRQKGGLFCLFFRVCSRFAADDFFLEFRVRQQ
jgi:predicted unusual protein kinase regulating ubiquinone biosynthesis (AarF/ABC1/UbiB family)